MMFEDLRHWPGQIWDIFVAIVGQSTADLGAMENVNALILPENHRIIYNNYKIIYNNYKQDVK